MFTDKTYFVPFAYYINSLPKIEKLEIDNVVIKRAKSVKYLGVDIDENLRWSEHVKNVIKRLRYLPLAFYKMKNFLNKNQMLIIYHALCASVMHYGIITWGGTRQTVLESLEKLHKSILQVKYDKPKLYSSAKLYKKWSLLNIFLK